MTESEIQTRINAARLEEYAAWEQWLGSPDSPDSVETVLAKERFWRAYETLLRLKRTAEKIRRKGEEKC
jgi:hypothetical protein